MKLESAGILLNLRPFGERDCIATVFTRDYGVLFGMMRGALVARKNKQLVGQIGAVSWNARLDSQLGVFHWESAKNLIAPLMSDGIALGQINSIFSLIATLLPEREKYESLYDKTLQALENFNKQSDASICDIYLLWEQDLLKELGYALDLSHCSGCGATVDLDYLSPRTGRAVCNKCAAPYIGRLYELPLTLDITKKFLEKICIEQGIDLPIRRKLI